MEFKNKVIMKNIALYILSAICLLFVSCNETIENVQHYVRLSVTGHTFYAVDTVGLKVSVKSDTEWTAEPSEDWIVIDQLEDSSVVIKVLPNETSVSRTGNVVFNGNEVSASFYVEQLSPLFEGTFYEFPSNCLYPAISPTGKYIASMKVNVPIVSGEPYTYTPLYVDVVTGKQYEMEPIKDYDTFMAISDDARVMVFSNSLRLMSTLYIDGQPAKISLPENCSAPFIQAVSSDGSVMVGWCYKSLVNVGGSAPAPVRWINGEPELLESPETDLRGQTLLRNGAMARGCSADGSVIYGSEWRTFGTIYWVDGEMHYIKENECYRTDTLVVESMFGPYEDIAFSAAQNENLTNCMSSDGKYIATCYKDFTKGNNGFEYTQHPAIINTETGKVEIFFNEGGRCLCVDNEGRAYGTNTTMAFAEPLIYNQETGEVTNQLDWFQSEYGLHLSGSRHIWYVAEDRSVYFGVRAQAGALGDIQAIPWYFKPAK